LRLAHERRSKKHRTRASEERAAVDHWIIPQAFCGSGLCGAWGHRVGFIEEPSLQAGRESNRTPRKGAAAKSGLLRGVGVRRAGCYHAATRTPRTRRI
jgi:hypothetical protein